MLRLTVIEASGEPPRVIWDEKKNLGGRGAWLCGPGCLAAAFKKKAFNRAWRAALPLDLSSLEGLVADNRAKTGPAAG